MSNDQGEDGTENTHFERRRALSGLLGLPNSCAVRLCRRKGYCMITEAICLNHHEDLARQRIDALLIESEDGDNENEDEEDEDDDDDD